MVCKQPHRTENNNDGCVVDWASAAFNGDEGRIVNRVVSPLKKCGNFLCSTDPYKYFAYWKQAIKQ